MVKNIKKSFKYFIIVAGITILFPTLLYLALQIPEVQTLLVKRITNHFSSTFKSTISIGSIEYRFFNKLSISDILLKDRNNDTLAYSQNVNVVIKRMDFKNKSFRFGRVTILNPVVAFITDSTGLMNLTWYLDLFKNPSDTTQKTKNKFTIDQIDLSGARFSMVNNTAIRGKTKMDLNNLNIFGINGIIEDLKIEKDTTSFNVYNFAFKERSGLSVNRMSCSVSLASQNILVRSAFLNLDSSILNITRLGLSSDSSGSFKNFAEEVKLDILVEKSLIYTSDLEYFLPIPGGLNESVRLSGKLFGTVSELRGRNIILSYRDYSSLDCDFDFSGLPRIENAFIYIGVNSLKTNVKDIENINIPKKGHIIVPEVLKKAGNIAFNGSFTGFTRDFVTYGQFRTDIGNIRTDISLRPEESKRYRVKGLLTGSDIDIGVMTEKPELFGKLSIKANVDGFANSFNKFAGNLTGKIDSIEINKYKYRDVALNGYFTEKTWDGSVKIADNNIKLDLLGMFNFRNKLPEFDFTLNLSEANLFNLNLNRLDTTSSLTLLLTSNFKGNSIDNIDGEIKLLNSTYRKNNNTLELYDFSVRTYTDNNNPVLSLRTDFVDVDIRGHYNFAAIGSLIKSTLATLMPSQFPAVAKRNDLIKNNFVFDINFKNTDKINAFFKTGILLADKSYIRGSVFPDSLMKVEGNTKSLNIKNNIINDFTLNASLEGSELSVDLNSRSLLLMEQSELKGFSVKLNTKPDNFTFIVDWDNKDKVENKGNFAARGSIVKNIKQNDNAILIVDIDSTQIYSRNNCWKISKSSIRIDSNSVNLNKFYISNKERYYLIDGTISENPADTLHLEFKDIDISPINYLGNQKSMNDPNRTPYNLKGQLNGKILLNNVYKNLLLESDIVVNNFSLLGSEFGNVSVNSALDIARKIVKISASNNLAGQKMFDLKGTYDPTLKKIDLTAITTRLTIDALNPLLRFFASGISGYATGKVNLSGPTDNLVLKGAVMAENASMKIDYLQSRFKLNDTIRFDKEGIKFNNVRLTDEKGNPAILSGSIKHKNLKNYTADIIINIMNPSECLVLNTKPKDNKLFYGTAYASGVTTIKSGPNSVAFDISSKTGKNTKFYIPLYSSLSVSENSFISFVGSDNKKEEEPGKGGKKVVATPATTSKTALDINFDLEVTPDAEVQIIFDSKIGDIMKGRGSGNLNITYNKKGEFGMSGDYIIEDGDYLFTLGNIFNKSFSVENGGKIIFNGDLDNAEIDIKAIYKLKASLDNILQDTSLKERIPVECQLNLTGKLFNPIVSFNIYLPTANEQERTNLRNAISTEEELSRQFLYLLVMNSFYNDPSYGYQAGGSSPSGTSAMAVTTTEMLSNQLSNWLSQISNDFDIGFVYRPGTGNKNINPQEVQVALSTQLLNDKVIINGNFDVKGTSSAASNTEQITGEFDAEVKITEKVRFKVFNRFNDTYLGKGPYTQGIGIFFKQDFDRFSDLFRKKTKSDMKKEDETTIQDQ
jgi:hypothetical protein